MSDLLRLPIDQYERYRLVADLADRLRPVGRPLRVLDIGGRTGLLCEFLPDDHVLRVDREASDRAEGLVLGDGARLPFADRAFDLVVACDTLEHVPPADREAFVSECARVSAAHVILIGPFASSRVREAEQGLRDFLKAKLDLEHRYLDEHAAHGLPSRRAVRGWFEARGGRTAEVGHGNLQRWLGLMCLEIFLESDPDLQRFAPSFYAFYNAGCYSTDDRGPVYRHALIAAVEGATLPDLDGLFAESTTPPELFEALLRFAPDLTIFDAAREEWRRERAAFEETLSIQTRELAEHREVMAELQRELEAEREHSARLRAMREGELQDRASLAARAEDAEQHAGTLDARREELEVGLAAVTENRDRLLEEVGHLREEALRARAAAEALGQAREVSEAARESAAASFGHQLAMLDQERLDAEAQVRRLASVGSASALGPLERVLALDAQLAAAHALIQAQHRERAALSGELEALAADRGELRDRLVRLQRRLAARNAGPALPAPASVTLSSTPGPDARRNRRRGRRRPLDAVRRRRARRGG